MAITRLAPSPTGALHLGNLRTFLVTWAWARSHGAGLVFRLEDLDSPRRKPGAAEAVLADLTWAGINWDGSVFVQSQDLAPYENALRTLWDSGRVYPCTCSRADLENAASAPHAEHEWTYPGTCRGRYRGIEEALSTGARQLALRFTVPAGEIRFDDLCAGPCTIDPSRVGGDFVVARRHADGRTDFAYQLAVVVDDAAMRVDHVIRGDDLLSSVPRQRLLQRTLGLPEVAYAHVPLVIGEDGRRLAKRHGDTRVSVYREAGVSPARLVEWAASSLGLDAHAFRSAHPRRFEWGALRRSPVVVSSHRVADGPPPPIWRDPRPEP